MERDDKLINLLNSAVNEELIRISLSKTTDSSVPDKVKIRPIVVKERVVFQVTESVGSKESNTRKEIHSNKEAKELTEYILSVFPLKYRQALIETKEAGFTVLAGKKGNITIVKNKKVTERTKPLNNNISKQYIINEGDKVPFLTDLGVMTKDGLIVKSKYDKFRQINRYLEFIRDIIPKLLKDRKLTIIDFGCGKSYLTFALYYYLSVKQNIPVHIIGLDLKTDVIAECNKLKNRYGYKELEFIEGDIERFEGVDKVDMVISLHACDTATDYSIYKAIKWDATVIMAVPCCQHELNKSMSSPLLKDITRYGLLKERLAAIATDALRADILTNEGYDTQILEFIDMEHTPKNLLIRAVKSDKRMKAKSDTTDIAALSDIFNAHITLEGLLNNER